MDFRVAPNFASFRVAGFRDSPGRPVFLTSPCNAFDPGFRFPFFLHLRLCRRWSSESPRTSHPSAVPIDRSPGRPELRSLGIAFDPLFGLPRLADRPAPAGGLPSRLGSRALRLCSGESSSLPEPLSSGIPAVKIRVAPVLRSPGSVSGPDFQVALNLRSSDVADDWIRGSPRLTVPRLSVYAFPGCPGSAIYGWVDDESLAVLELCILSLRRG
jgi:hypothetical protein